MCSCEINPFCSEYAAGTLSAPQSSKPPWWINQESYLADEVCSKNKLEQNLEMVIKGSQLQAGVPSILRGDPWVVRLRKPLFLLSLAGTSWASQGTLFTDFSLVTIEELRHLNLAGGLDWCAFHAVTRPVFDTKSVHMERGSNPWLPQRLVHLTSHLHHVLSWTHWEERCEASLNCWEFCSLSLHLMLIFI